MSRGNKRGPEEMGPMTGRGLGTCAGSDRPGYQVDAPPAQGGRGRGNGYGNRQGRGFRHGGGRGMGHGVGRGNRWRQAGYAAPDEMVQPHTDSPLVKEVAELKSQLAALTAKIDKLFNRE